MDQSESPVVIPCANEQLVGIIHPGSPRPALGVVFIVGGPQYRVGSHRSFVNIARRIACEGMPVLRFDARGKGDSTGRWPGFEQTGPDIEAAVDCLMERFPTLEGVVLMGLCDGASAGLLYAPYDRRVAGLILLNPWIRSEDGRSRYAFKHYYLPRLRNVGHWKRFLRGDVRWGANSRELAALVKRLISSTLGRKRGRSTRSGELADRMIIALKRFDRPVLVLISGADMVGKEFAEVWKSLAGAENDKHESTFRLKIFSGANHTFTYRADLDAVSEECAGWLSDLSR